jgi:nucleoside-diphosphate-sugar epimerase
LSLSKTNAADRTQRLIVLGGTSLIGRFLLPRLADIGLFAHAISRKPPSIERAWSENASSALHWVEATLDDPRSLTTLPAADAILSLSPIWLLPKALTTLLETTGARRVIAFSSTSRLTKLKSEIAEERATAQRLAAGEDETIGLCIAAGAAWTLFRPTLIYAEGQDQNISRLAAMIRRLGFLPLAGSGRGLRQPVHADDLAGAALAALNRTETFNALYNLPGGETLTYRAMAERVFEGLGRRPLILPIPPPLWQLGLALARPLLPGATAAMGSRMSEDLTFDAEPAVRDFGWSPRGFRPQF